MGPALTRPDFGAILVDELRPYEGRLGMALRMALACMIVVLVAMSQEVPEAALSCYLIFFASRNNAASGILIAVALIVAASIGILIGLLFLQFAADEPMIRLGLMALFTFGGMYFAQATRAGPIAATVGFVFAFVMTLYDFVPVPELLSRGLSWMWVVVFFPMATLILVNALLGPNPAELARKGVARRLEAAAGLLRGKAGEAGALLAEGTGEIPSLARLGGLFGFARKPEARRLAAIAPQAQALLALAGAARPDPLLAEDLSRLARAIVRRDTLPPLWRVRHAEPANAPLAEQAETLAALWSGRLPLPDAAGEKAPLLAPDAFSNPAYTQFALKTLLAVLITYTIYTAWDWFEVHTAMITCFYVALGSTGETLHKAGLRILGCLVGAAMGIGAIVFLMPHMTDVGHLLLLVGAGSFIAAWISTGTSRIQYMGWQMALAFFLCVLQGYGPGFDTAVATNRIIGILIGNAVVALVFLSFWPVSIGTGVTAALRKATDILRIGLAGRSASLAEVPQQLAEAKRLAGLSVFEVSRLRLSQPVLPHVPVIARGLDEANAILTRMALLRARPRFLHGAPRCVKAATFAQQASAQAFLRAAASAIVAPGPQARHDMTQALAQSAKTLSRLDRQVRCAEQRAPWRADLAGLSALYAALHEAGSNTVEALP